MCHSCVLLGSHSGSVLGKQLAPDASEEVGSVRAGPETCLPQEPSARGSTLAACPASMSEPTWQTLLYCGADQPLLATTACTLPLRETGLKEQRLFFFFLHGRQGRCLWSRKVTI